MRASGDWMKVGTGVLMGSLLTLLLVLSLMACTSTTQNVGGWEIDNAAAITGGLATGQPYRTATGGLMVVYTP